MDQTGIGSIGCQQCYGDNASALAATLPPSSKLSCARSIVSWQCLPCGPCVACSAGAATTGSPCTAPMRNKQFWTWNGVTEMKTRDKILQLAHQNANRISSKESPRICVQFSLFALYSVYVLVARFAPDSAERHRQSKFCLKELPPPPLAFASFSPELKPHVQPQQPHIVYDESSSRSTTELAAEFP